MTQYWMNEEGFDTLVRVPAMRCRHCRSKLIPIMSFSVQVS
jgi:hypothetical protein